MPFLHQTQQRVQPRRLWAWIAFALAALGLASAGWPSSASAAEYEVEVCTANSTGDGLVPSTEGDPGPLLLGPCGFNAIGGIRQRTPGGTVLSGGGISWTLIAPEDTRILTLSLEQSFTQSVRSFLDWFLFSGNGAQLAHLRNDRLVSERPLPAPVRVTYRPNSRSVTSVLGCIETILDRCSGGEFAVTLKDLVAVLEDSFVPTVFAPNLAGDTVRGVISVPYNASDAGSGVASAALIVDDTARPIVPDLNDGKCQRPYRFVLPCRLRVSASLPLDTRALGDGQHQVRVAVVDAAGQRTVSAPTTFTVHNAPTNTGQPIVTGQARVGQQLTGTAGSWAGEPTAFAYQWLRCPATVTARATSGCAPIAGATSPRYSPTAADVGQRNLVQVTATNASGTGSDIGGPSDVVTDVGAPVLSQVSLSRKRLLIGKAPAAAKMLLRFSSSEAGDLSIVIDRMRGKKRPKRIGTLAAKVKSGRSAVLLSTAIGKKRLTPGRYRATITVKDREGNLSQPAQISFAVASG